jgi:hypothetical protein
MADKQKRIFNLLKPVEPPPTVWDKIYNWILGKARIVILITELLIAVAFVGKVIEDTIAKNKDKEIESIKTELSFYANSKEAQFREIQRKEVQYNLLWTNSSGYYKILKEIYSIIPNTGAEITVKFEGNKVTIFGFDDLEFVKQIEQSLKGSQSFTGVAVNNLNINQKESSQAQGKFVLIANIINPNREMY